MELPEPICRNVLGRVSAKLGIYCTGVDKCYVSGRWCVNLEALVGGYCYVAKDDAGFFKEQSLLERTCAELKLRKYK